MCLICNETVAIVKSGNVKRPYDFKHGHFDHNFLLKSEVRARKIKQLQSLCHETV